MSDWSKAQIELLVRLKKHKRSTDEIVATINERFAHVNGRVTANAVKAMAHRVGITEKPPMNRWTEEQREFVRSCFRQGMSNTGIANLFNEKFKPDVEVSRCSVQRQLSNMQLRRGVSAGVRRPKTKLVSSGQPHPAAPEPVSDRVREIRSLAPELVNGRPVTVSTLEPHLCRFPIGDPRDESFAFCGRPRDGANYCTQHNMIAYTKERPQQKRLSFRNDPRPWKRFSDGS